MSILSKIKSFFYRPPDVIIGYKEDPYLHRWHIIPRNKWFNIYLHKFLRDDEDRALHDHPFVSISFLIKGRYIEHTKNKVKLFKTPNIIYRNAEYAHRIELVDSIPAWSVFITGPRIRTWGFHCPKRWIPWYEFVEPTVAADGTVYSESTKGCGEN